MFVLEWCEDLKQKAAAAEGKFAWTKGNEFRSLAFPAGISEIRFGRELDTCLFIYFS
jgi:hypothetical protein